MRYLAILSELERFGYGIRMGTATGTYPYGHQHHGFELLFLHSGTTEFSIAGRCLHLSPGQALLLRGDLMHRARPLRRSYSRTALHFYPELVNQSDFHFMEESTAQGCQVYALYPESTARLIWVARELSGMAGSGRHSRQVIRSLLSVVAAELREAPTRSNTVPALLWDILEFMRSEPSRPLHIAEICQRFHYSPSHIRKLFSQHTGYSPQQYWLRVKMQQACELLRTPSPVAQVAAEVGFNSTRSFQRAFRQVMGVSPSDYRHGTHATPDLPMNL